MSRKNSGKVETRDKKSFFQRVWKGAGTSKSSSEQHQEQLENKELYPDIDLEDLGRIWSSVGDANPSIGLDLEDLMQRTEKAIASLAETEKTETEEPETVKAVVEVVETEFVPSLYVIPDYNNTIINWSTLRWQISDPITLCTTEWPQVEAASGIYLEKGLYKIHYTLSGWSKDSSGLAIFNQNTKQFKKFITWYTWSEESHTVLQAEGSRFVELNSSALLGIADNSGKYQPRQVRVVYIVSIHKAITQPK